MSRIAKSLCPSAPLSLSPFPTQPTYPTQPTHPFRIFSLSGKLGESGLPVASFKVQEIEPPATSNQQPATCNPCHRSLQHLLGGMTSVSSVWLNSGLFKPIQANSTLQSWEGGNQALSTRTLSTRTLSTRILPPLTKSD